MSLLEQENTFLVIQYKKILLFKLEITMNIVVCCLCSSKWIIYLYNWPLLTYCSKLQPFWPLWRLEKKVAWQNWSESRPFGKLSSRDLFQTVVFVVFLKFKWDRHLHEILFTLYFLSIWQFHPGLTSEATRPMSLIAVVNSLPVPPPSLVLFLL